MLSLAEVSQLLKTYQYLKTQTKEHSTSPIQSHETEISIFNRDKNFTKLVHQSIVAAFQPHTDVLLQQYKAVMGNMVYKKPHETKDFHLHQDWRFSDETKYIGITIWCPLVDTNIENGTLYVVEKSHLFQKNTFRGVNIGDASNHISNYIKSYFGTPISLKAGQAVIMNTQLYHFSPPNCSDKARPATLLTMIPQEATMFLYYRQAKQTAAINKILEHKMQESFMLQFNIDTTPNDAKDTLIDYQITYFNKNLFLKLYQKYNGVSWKLYLKIMLDTLLNKKK